MKKLLSAAVCSLSLIAVALPQLSFAANAACETKAVDKNGKPLAGAAKSSFMKKCEADTMKEAAAACQTKAVDKNGKPLAGAAKNSFMKKCESDSAK
jgi:hypothetical protein